MPLTCHYFTKNTNSSDSHFTSGNPRPRYGILWKRPSVNSRHAHIRRQWHSATEHLMHNVKYQKIIIFIDVISISRCISQKQSCTLSLNIVYTGNRCIGCIRMYGMWNEQILVRCKVLLVHNFNVGSKRSIIIIIIIPTTARVLLQSKRSWWSHNLAHHRMPLWHVDRIGSDL